MIYRPFFQFSYSATIQCDLPSLLSLAVHLQVARTEESGTKIIILAGLFWDVKVQSMSTKRRHLNWKDGPIAVDTDYDDRSLLPRQSFFPMDGTSGSRANLARNLRAEVDTLQTKAYRGTASQSFKADEHRCALVKIVDNRDTETLKIVELR